MVRSKRTHKRAARLKREYEQFLQNPIPNCGVLIDESNISIWHINIMVPELDNVVFHFIATYPENYPETAPKVRNCTYISHKNVFGSYICLDILTMSEATKNTPYRGWTTAYTISSLLVQLQSFLFEAVAERRGKDRMIREARNYTDPACGHNGLNNIIPEILTTCTVIKDNKKSEAVETSSSAEEVFYLEAMDNVVKSVLFTMLDESTLANLRYLTIGDKEAIDLAFTKKRYRCFYTLKTIEDEGVVMGIGAKKFIMDRVSRKTRKRKPALQQLHCCFDFITLDAFKMGVKNSIWKDRDFDVFIPLCINREHAKRSLPLAEKLILELWNCRELDEVHRSISGEMILTTLAKMMNTTVVNMMKTVEDLEAGELQMFDSIKALEGFTAIHHLLLAFAEKYTDIKATATARVKRFIENPIMRDKEVTPDIGELLIDVAISDYTWDDFSPFWIEECFVRNARWILAKHPNLLELEEISSCVRLTQSFTATRTGKRLAMFQRFFITEVASPDRLRGNPKKNKILLTEYNNRLGMPPKGMAKRLQDHSRAVIACNNWWDYFELVNFCPPSCAHLAAWLRNSVIVSAEKEYHNRRNIMRYTSNWVTLPTDKLQTDPLNCICCGDVYRLPEKCDEISSKPGSKPELKKKKKAGIDICFVLDCTGSMSSWINEAKKSIKDIIKNVSKKCNRNVRFAIAGYRDHHSQGYGKDRFVVRSFDFTSDASEAKDNVSEFSAAGGADYPEAMCAAMAEAANMSWNRDSHQIVITIADAPPHGLGASGDDYPNGDPDGHDTLRIAHTMRENGIVIYPVDCGSSDPLRQTFFHALARITGGYALDLQNASLLSKVVVNACMEESALDELADKIAPHYEHCLKHHAQGRFEQHCQAVFSECKARNITVESSLPADNYNTTEERQVSSMAYCMDLKHAKRMYTDDYFGSIRRNTKFCSHMERPVTLQQVTKCMKRMKDVLAIRQLMKDGCTYKSAPRFSKEAFKERWTKFKKERNIRRKFSPWSRIKPEQRREYRKIPDGSKLKRVGQKSVPLTKKQFAETKRNFTPDLVGKEVEILKSGFWRKVQIAALLKNGKVGVQVNGVKMSINDSTKWRHIAGKAPAVKPAASEVAPTPWTRPAANTAVTAPAQPVAPTSVISPEVSTTVTAPEPPVVATTAPEPAPTTVPIPTPPSSEKDVAAVRPTTVPVPPVQETREFTPDRTVAPEKKKLAQKYKLDDLVLCTMDLSKPPMRGVITRVRPHLLVRLDGKDSNSYRFRYVKPFPMKEYICKINLKVYPFPNPTVYAEAFGMVDAGSVVKVVQFEGDWAEIQKPHKGWIRADSKHRKLIVEAGLDIKEVKPTIIVTNIPANCSPKDVALSCKLSNFPAKHVRGGRDGSGNKAVQLIFDKHSHADCIMTIGLSHFGEAMDLSWCPKYLEYRHITL